ncbi:MAG: transglutaminase-like domain-containing protein [Lachnoclostridium sp.]|nr:transglutaminase-like domain-containing protein [Lachnoclostridium sp.]
MRRSKKLSGSALRAKSSGRDNKTYDSEIELAGRELTSFGEEKSRPLFWFFAAFLQLFMLSAGFAGMCITGFSLQISAGIFYPALSVLCAAAAVFFFGETGKGRWRILIFAVILVYLVMLFMTQDTFMQGACAAWNAVIRSVNARYDGKLALLAAGAASSQAMTIFLLEVLAPLILILAACVVYRADALWMTLVLFPLTAFVLLTAGKMSVLMLFLFLFGVLSTLAASRSVRKKRMWGEVGSERFERNLESHKSIQRKTALMICAASLVVAVPGFYLVRPVLDLQLDKAERVTNKVEGEALSAILGILPEISGGKWNLQVENAGGGVADGALGETDGFALAGVEDLQLTASAEPAETIYLKGFVGSGYDVDRWIAPDEQQFTDAAVNWKTEGDPALYLQNLSFLRALYVENQSGTNRMQELTVERLNANDGYTYFPYHSFLNDYYEVLGGDGGVNGQEVQEDIFSYYPRKVYNELIESWNKDEGNKSVLDKTEASYAAYAKAHYLEVPAGFGKLEEQCKKQKIKDGDADKAKAYIKTWLSENYTYSMDVPELPEGEDFVKYFLYDTKSGYSTHFASAATLMFRMFGVPARYVTGYAAPKNLFTAQPDGTYTAILQEDNSHAWVEIYVDGEGWTPVEMTPGAVGTAEEVEYQGEEAVDEGTPKEEMADSEGKESLTESLCSTAEVIWSGLMDGSLESVIQVLAVAIAALVLTVFAVRFGRRYRRDYGLDKKKSPEERIVDIFGAIYHFLVKKGLPSDVESSSDNFHKEVRRIIPSLSEKEYERMMKLVMESSYGPQKRTEKDVEYMRAMYRRIKKEKQDH